MTRRVVMDITQVVRETCVMKRSQPCEQLQTVQPRQRVQQEQRPWAGKGSQCPRAQERRRMNLVGVSGGDDIGKRSRSPPRARICRIMLLLLWSLKQPCEVGTLSSALHLMEMRLREGK